MFYTFSQNNSGGTFKVSHADGIAQFVIIEANSLKHACDRAEYIGLYFNGCDDGRDCPCCGDRWNTHADEYETPLVYGEKINPAPPLSEYEYKNNYKDYLVYTHYLNGTVELGSWSYNY